MTENLKPVPSIRDNRPINVVDQNIERIKDFLSEGKSSETVNISNKLKDNLFNQGNTLKEWIKRRKQEKPTLQVHSL